MDEIHLAFRFWTYARQVLSYYTFSSLNKLSWAHRRLGTHFSNFIKKRLIHARGKLT